jgi:hypothetical protein
MKAITFACEGTLAVAAPARASSRAAASPTSWLSLAVRFGNRRLGDLPEDNKPDWLTNVSCDNDANSGEIIFDLTDGRSFVVSASGLREMLSAAAKKMRDFKTCASGYQG